MDYWKYGCHPSVLNTPMVCVSGGVRQVQKQVKIAALVVVGGGGGGGGGICNIVSYNDNSAGGTQIGTKVAHPWWENDDTLCRLIIIGPWQCNL